MQIAATYRGQSSAQNAEGYIIALDVNERTALFLNRETGKIESISINFLTVQMNLFEARIR